MYDTLTLAHPVEGTLTLITWYFGNNKHFQRVRDFCCDAKVQFTTGTAAFVPDGDFDTDDDEFITWFEDTRAESAEAAPSKGPSPASPLTLLRAAVKAKQQLWGAFNSLENVIAPGGQYTDRQNDAAYNAIDSLAAGGEPESIGPAELEIFLQAVGITAARPAAAPVVPLTFSEFKERYHNALRQGGTACTADDINSSWSSYEADPAGHFISRHPPAPKFVIGQWVYVSVKKAGTANDKWEWSGQVKTVNNAGSHDDASYEYLVSGGPVKGSGEFPLLAWESELEPMYAPDGTVLARAY